MIFILDRLVFGCGKWLVGYACSFYLKSLLTIIILFSKLFVREFVPKSFHRILPCGSTRLTLATRLHWEETKNFLTLTFSWFSIQFSLPQSWCASNLCIYNSSSRSYSKLVIQKKGKNIWDIKLLHTYCSLHIDANALTILWSITYQRSEA